MRTAHARVRAIAAGAARPRPVGRTAGRDPLRQQHRARAAGARCDVRAASCTRRSRRPIRCSRVSTRRCGQSVAALRPGLVFADGRGPLRARARERRPGGAEMVTVLAVAVDADHTIRRARATRGDARPWTTRTRAVAGDTIAKILYTSGSTGRPKGVINTQRMLCSNQEMLRTVLPLLADEPPVLCDWLPWNHTFGGNHNFGTRALQRRHALHRRRQADAGGVRDDARQPPRDCARPRTSTCREATSCSCRGSRADAAICARSSSAACACCSAPRPRCARDRGRSRRGGAGDARGERIPLVTGLGATESAPFALVRGRRGASPAGASACRRRASS